MQPTKLMKALNDSLIAIVFFTDFAHVKNSWAYELLVRVPADYNNNGKHTERIIEDTLYIVIDGETHLKSEAHATAQAILALNEKITQHQERQNLNQ